MVEEKFSRPMSSLWLGCSVSLISFNKSARGPKIAAVIWRRLGAQVVSIHMQVVALPVDCTADLAVSRHLWVTTPAQSSASMVSRMDTLLLWLNRI